MSIPSGAMSESEWQEFIGSVEDRTALKLRLQETCGRTGRCGFVSQAKEALDRLQDSVKLQATPAHARQIVLTVMEVGDELADTEDKDVVGGIIPITNELRICWLLQEAIGKVDSPTERVEIIEEALKQKVGIHTAAELVKVLGYEHGMFNSSDKDRTSPGPPLVPQQMVEEFAKAVVSIIKEAAAGGSLATHPLFMDVVWHWRLFDSGEKANEWVRQLATSDEYLVKIIRQIRGEIRSHSFSDRVMTATPNVDCEYLGQFVPVLEARRWCDDLLTASPDWITAEDRKSLQAVVANIGEDGSVHDPKQRRRHRPRNQDDVVADESKPRGAECGEGEADAET